MLFSFIRGVYPPSFFLLPPASSKILPPQKTFVYQKKIETAAIQTVRDALKEAFSLVL
jgi:hypothetical protein